MPTKRSWVWESYLLIYGYATIIEALNFFREDSPVRVYYLILKAINPAFIIKYLFNYYHVIFDLIHLVPLALYVFKRRLFHRDFWASLFILRVVFEVTGHSWDMNRLKAILHSQSTLAMATAAALVLFHIPSYIACYQYAFQKKQEG